MQHLKPRFEKIPGKHAPTPPSMAPTPLVAAWLLQAEQRVRDAPLPAFSNPGSAPGDQCIYWTIDDSKIVIIRPKKKFSLVSCPLISKKWGGAAVCFLFLGFF